MDIVDKAAKQGFNMALELVTVYSGLHPTERDAILDCVERTRKDIPKYREQQGGE